MPWIKEFVEKHKENPIENFSIIYKQGASPVLHMYDDAGDEATDSISISQWKTEHIVEFLGDKIKSS